MDAGVFAVDQFREQFLIRNASGNNFHPGDLRQGGNFGRVTGQDGYPVLPLNRFQRHIRADETGTAGRENVYVPMLL